MMVLGAISSHSIAATIRTGLVLATVCITCFHLSCSRTHAPERTPAVQLTRHLHLIPLLKENTPTIQGAQPLHRVKVEISEDRRMALLQAPPGSHVFTDLPSGPGKTLHTALGLLPKAWSAGSDGARFILSCTDPAKSSLTLTDVTIDHPQDWRKVAVELDQCSMPTTDLTFQTMCGSHGDCNWDWAAWASPEIEYEQFQTFRPKRLVLLISIDTLRADRLGLYGSDRATSTNLDHLAHDAVVFDKAYAPSPWTLPSHASLLTSTWPIVHGANQERGLPDALPLIQETFKDAGWQCAGFFDVDWLGPAFGFDRGFDIFRGRTSAHRSSLGAGISRERIIDWLTTADDRPAFVFWHIFDVHAPYGAPAPYGGMFRRTLDRQPGPPPQTQLSPQAHKHLQLDRFHSLEDLVASFDEGIAATDAIIGGLIDLLRQAGLYHSSLIVVTSDHGESLFDHKIWVGHGLFLNEDEVRVPLIIKYPNNLRAGTRSPSLVSLVDVAPTVLDALDLKIPTTFQGRSLLDDSPDAKDPPVFGFAEDTGSVSIRDQQFKFITGWGFEHSFSSRPELLELLRPKGAAQEFNRRLAAASGERVLRVTPEGREELLDDTEVPESLLTSYRGIIRAHIENSRRLAGAVGATGPEPALSPDQIEDLRSLGYLKGGHNTVHDSKRKVTPELPR